MNRLEDLIERTLGDDRRALHSPPSVVEGALIRAGRIRRRRAVVSAVAAVMVIVAGVAIAVPLLNDDGTAAKSGPITTQEPAPDETHNTAPALTSPLFAVTASTTTSYDVASVAFDGTSLFVVGEPFGADTGTVIVERLDRATMQVEAHQEFGGSAPHLTLSGGALWLVPGPSPIADSVGPQPLWKLDPATLQPLAHIATGTSAAALATASDGVWVSTRDKLIRVNSAGDKVVTIALDGALTDMASDVASGVLYTLGPSSTSAQVVTERDLSTGAVLATYDGTGPGGGSLSAASDGVWASLPTGTAGQVQFLSRNGLLASGEQSASNQIHASLVGGLLWVTDTDSLACADPATGTARATDSFPAGHTPAVLGGDGTAAYFQHGAGLYAVTPSATCSG